MIADVREVGDKKYAGRFQIGVSIGIATYPDRTDTVEQLLDVADVAMYEAKKGGGGRHTALERPQGMARPTS
jgi:diguanylate cyclase